MWWFILHLYADNIITSAVSLINNAGCGLIFQGIRSTPCGDEFTSLTVTVGSKISFVVFLCFFWMMDSLQLRRSWICSWPESRSDVVIGMFVISLACRDLALNLLRCGKLRSFSHVSKNRFFALSCFVCFPDKTTFSTCYICFFFLPVNRRLWV